MRGQGGAAAVVRLGAAAGGAGVRHDRAVRRHRPVRAALGVVVVLAGCAPAGTVPTAVRSPIPHGSPASVVPAPTAACPAGGVRIEAGDANAATGLRVLSLFLINCGDEPYEVYGHPAVRLLDEDRGQLLVRVLLDVREITHAPLGWDGPAQPVVLQPGERAGAAVAWRNTYDDSEHPPVNAHHLEVAPEPGRPAQVVTPAVPLDLGSTGRIGLTPWRRTPDAAPAPAPDRVPAPASTPAPEAPPIIDPGVL